MKNLEQSLQNLQVQRAQGDAEKSTQRTLLNCYIREVARPKNQLLERPDPQLLQSLPLGWRYAQRSTHTLLLVLPETKKHIAVPVSRMTKMDNYRYAYPLLIRASEGAGAAWKTLSAYELAETLVAEICCAEQITFNEEFVQQVQLSMQTKVGIRLHEQVMQMAQRKEQAGLLEQFRDLYLYSEQSLTYGHAYHPTPKSRQWEVGASEASYAPEYRQSFQMHWFAVKKEWLRVETVAPLSPEQLVADITPEGVAVEAGYRLIPVHPVQARYLLQQACVQKALLEKNIQDMGVFGDFYYPTASVRTLYNPNKTWFLKGSLNVRITNCVRKNAIYELESALALHKRLQAIEPLLVEQHQGFRLLGEPGFLTVNLPELSYDDNKIIQEGFGMVVRQNINQVLANEEQAVLAGALFQQGDPLGDRVIIADKIQWMKAYAEALIPPMLAAYFDHGLIFEPHLQNTVICLKEGTPTGVIVRDFEGVKLVDQRWPETTLSDLSPRARQSVHYSANQGWNRVLYCLFINNLTEAVTWLADDQSALEANLWQTVQEVVVAYLNRENQKVGDKTELNQRIGALLDGEALPGKTNLLVRLSKSPDKAAGYVPVPSPFSRFALATMPLPDEQAYSAREVA